MLNAEKEAAHVGEKSLVYDRYVWVDLDRTLVDPDLTMQRFYRAALASGVEGDKIKQIEEERVRSEARLISFEPLSQISRLDEQKFISAFLEDTTNIAYPDSEPFIKQLRNSGIRFNILTYGVNSVWQGLKLKASKFNGDGLIIDTPKKLDYFASRTDDSGNYRIDNNGRITARSLVLIDDKPEAFYSGDKPQLPAECSGFLVIRDQSRLQDRAIPEGVDLVSDLSELTVRNGRIVKRHRK